MAYSNDYRKGFNCAYWGIPLANATGEFKEGYLAFIEESQKESLEKLAPFEEDTREPAPDLNGAIELLRELRVVFEEYADNHFCKGTTKGIAKAKVNQDYALKITNLLKDR